MGTRQRSQLPIKDSRKQLQNPNSERTINDNKVPKDLNILSSGKNRLKNSSNIPAHLRDPLTPLHRLRRFKEIRDRNFKKSSFGKAVIGKPNKNKMSVDVEKDDTSKGRRSVKEVKGIKDKISNGTQENGDKSDEISLKNEDKNPPVEENREVNGSQEIGLTEKSQKIVADKQQNEAEKIVQNDAEKPRQIDSEAPLQIEIEKPKQIESEKKCPQIENEQNETDKIVNEKEEKQNIIKEKEIIAKENNDNKIDNSKESNKKVDIGEEDDEIEVLEVDSDEEENRETDYESFSNDEPQEKVKILRRSYRQELIRAKASESTNASTSSTNASTSSTKATSIKASTSSAASTSKQFLEKPKDVTVKQSSLSPETIRRIKSRRVEGRRSLWQSTGIHRKRKYDDHNEGYNERYGKKPASSETLGGTPSVLSPGWKFISSPFTRFWTPKSSPEPGTTPYKSFSMTTPYSQNNDIEDSLAVNVDDKSLYNKLNDSEFDISLNSTESTASTGSWRCNIM